MIVVCTASSELHLQFSSVAQSCPTPWDPMNRSTPGLPVHHQLLEFTQIHVHWVRDAIQPSHPLSSPSPPAPNPSQHQSFFSNESTLHMRWPKYWSFSFSTIPSKEIPGMISFRMDWLDLLAVQGTLTELNKGVNIIVQLGCNFCFKRINLINSYEMFKFARNQRNINWLVGFHFCQQNFSQFVCLFILYIYFKIYARILNF